MLMWVLNLGFAASGGETQPTQVFSLEGSYVENTTLEGVYTTTADLRGSFEPSFTLSGQYE